jgi:hypothetical protein
VDQGLQVALEVSVHKSLPCKSKVNIHTLLKAHKKNISLSISLSVTFDLALVLTISLLSGIDPPSAPILTD